MEFKEHLKKYLSDEEIDKLLSSQCEEAKHALLLNTEKMSEEEFIKLFPNVKPHPIVPHVFIYDNEEYPFGKSIYHDLGLYYLFEPCSPIVSFLLSPTENDVVLDVAAAPGGKSLHSSLLMKNKGIIISNEIQLSRSLILSSNVERLGRKNMIVSNSDINAFLPNYKNTFSKIILDAPCSGSGMFRKQESMKDDWTYNKVLTLSELQKDLITKAYELLAPNGVMVYSTCSFSYEEDEEVIKHLLETTDAELKDFEDSPMFYHSKENIGIHLFPYLFPGEGHYVCLIQKPGEDTTHIKEVKDDLKNIHKLCNIEDGYIYEHNKVYYLIDRYFDIRGLHLVRGGLKLGINEKYGFDYDYALSHYLPSFNNQYELNDDELKKYIAGEQLNLKVNDGIVLFTYHSMGVGFGKATKNKINNKYPKGLRRR